MIHFVFSTEQNFYQEWQSEFLWRSFHGYGLGKWAKLTRLIAADNRELLYPILMPHAVTPNYKNYKGADYVALNKPGSVLYWISNNKIEEEYVCILDPDMIFIKPMLPEDVLLPKKNEIVGTQVWYMSPAYKSISTIADLYRVPHDQFAPAGVPYLFRTEELKEFAKLWLELSVDIHHSSPYDWLPEMYGFSIALHQMKKKFVYWDKFCFENNQFILPDNKYILHYCSEFNNYQCNWNWKKHLWKEGPFPLDLESIPKKVSLPTKIFFENLQKYKIDQFKPSMFRLRSLYIKSDLELKKRKKLDKSIKYSDKILVSREGYELLPETAVKSVKMKQIDPAKIAASIKAKTEKAPTG